MMLKHFKRAVKRLNRPAAPARMMTDGFEADTFTDEVYRYATATRQGDGTYEVTFMENNSPVFSSCPATDKLTLRQALEVLDAWERKRQVSDRPYELRSGFDVPYFRDIATQHGITLGPDAASLRHAAKIKSVARGRCKRPR